MGKQWEQWQVLFSWAPKLLQIVTAAMKLKYACSLEGNYNKPRQHIKNQRHHLDDKGPYSQSHGFSSSHVWMWVLKKKAEHRRIDTFQVWCWRRILRCKKIKPVNPKGNQPWIFTGRTDAEAEAPILGHLMRRADSLENTLMLGKIEGRRRGRQRMRWSDGITNSMDMNLSKLQVKDRETCCAAVYGVTKNQTWLSDWTTTLLISYSSYCVSLM